MKAFVLHVKTKMGMPKSINVLDLHTLHLVEQILSSYTSVNVYILVVRLDCSELGYLAIHVRFIFILSHKCRGGTVQCQQYIEENESYPEIYPLFLVYMCIVHFSTAINCGKIRTFEFFCF